MMKNCCNNIRKIRRDKDLTQEYIAYELGISQKSYSELENGKVRLNIITLSKIAEILNVNPSKLCELSDNCVADMQKRYDDLIDFIKHEKINIPDRFLNHN